MTNQNRHPKRAVVFDLDGTLLDTLTDLTHSVNHALGVCGYPKRSMPEIRRFLGNGALQLIRESVPAHTGEDEVARVLDAFRTHYVVHCMEHTKPYDGVMPMLSKLYAQGYVLSIVSNKPQDAVSELNERFFKTYVSTAIGDGENMRRKPAPDAVFKALDAMGSKPMEAVYVGDSEVDYATAKNAGVPCISVLWGFRDEDFLREIGVSCFARTPDEVVDVISRL